MTGRIYLDLIKAFFTNWSSEGSNLHSQVKGVDIEMTIEVWKTISGLKYASVQLGKVIKTFYIILLIHLGQK